MKRYYYSEDGKVIEGPVSRDRLRALLDAGEITESTRVRILGATEWQTAGGVFAAREVPAGELAEKPEAGGDRLRRVKLNWAAAIVLIAGLALASALYRHASPPSAMDDPASPPALEDSRRGSHQLEMVSGQTGLLAYRLTEWAGEQRSALCVGGATLILSAALAAIGSRRSRGDS